MTCEDELVLGAPDVVEIVPVRIEPQIVLVVVDVENVRVAVGVRDVHTAT
jgi:hypothetical protein